MRPHRRRLAFRLVLVLTAGGLTVTGPAGGRPVEAKKGKRAGKAAAGDGNAAQRAERMEKVGKAAYGKGEYGDALIAFEAAYEAAPQPKHLYNLARCHEQQGSLAKAADYYERYLREAPEAADREEVETRAEFLTTKLKKTMAKLVVRSEPPGAGLRVQGEGEKLDVKTPWSGWLAPGRYDVSVLLSEREEFTRKLALAAGDEQEVQAVAQAGEGEEGGAAVEEAGARAERTEPEAGGGAAARAPAEVAEPEEPGAVAPAPGEVVVAPAPAGVADEAGGLGTVPLAAFGLGAAALVSFGVFGGLALAGQAEVDEGVSSPGGAGKTRQEMEDVAASTNLYGAVANVSLVVAAAAGLTGGALLLVGGDGGQTTASARWTW